MLIIGSIVLFFSIREAIRNTKNQDLDYQKVLMMIRHNQIPLMKILAALLLFLPGWYIFYCFLIICCLGKKVFEDPVSGGSGAQIVKYRGQTYRYEDIAHFENEQYWYDSDTETA